MNSNLTRDGYEILRQVLSIDQCHLICEELAERLRHDEAGAIGSGRQGFVGGRNLQGCWTNWRDIVETPFVQPFLKQHLGERFGLVRILYFDKPPGRTWNLSLHRDGAIAVATHHDPPAPYSRPNHKAGVPHVHADQRLLEQMVTLRMHLDPMHTHNGPLTVVPKSHANLDWKHGDPIEIHCSGGDIFAMKPLLLHGSRSSTPGNRDHRRVVHMEFAPHNALEAPYRWFRYDEASILRPPSVSP